MYFTKEEFEYISKFEDNLRRAINSNYCLPFGNSAIDELLKIYKKIEPNYNLCKHCSSSILKFAKALGKFYFLDKAEIENNKEKNNKDYANKKCRKKRENGSG